MRAARHNGGFLQNNSTYRYIASSSREAAYLIAILNAPCLEQAFAQARESDRHFHLHPWRCVPIPLFSPKNKTHAALADLTVKAERAAAAWLAKQPPGKQISLSKGIRAELAGKDILKQIDDLVRALLPKQAR